MSRPVSTMRCCVCLHRKPRTTTGVCKSCGEKCKVTLACLGCGIKREYELDSNEANGVFNPFCPGGDCEDRYAARL